MPKSTTRWSTDGIFSEAWAYDLAFAWDLTREIDVALALAGLDTSPPGAKVLIPACGTGRHAEALSDRGFAVEGFDINEQMLTLARSRNVVRLELRHADMATEPLAPRHDCAAVFTFTNSFRYLLEAADVEAHLAAVRARLAANARYVIDLGLNPVAAHVGHTTRWAAIHEDCRVEASWQLTALDPPSSTELAVIRVERSEHAPLEFRSVQPQRVWTTAELHATAERCGLRVRGVHTPSGAAAADASSAGRYFVVLERTS